MNISPVSFQGQAYFSRKALKTITPEYKERIEKYAANKPDDMDVFVTGQKIENGIEYQGNFYSEKQYTIENDYFTSSESEHYYNIRQSDGSKIRIPVDEAENVSRKLPVYNAYIFNETVYSSLDCPIVTKDFDFRPGEKSLLKIGDHCFIDDKF